MVVADRLLLQWLLGSCGGGIVVVDEINDLLRGILEDTSQWSSGDKSSLPPVSRTVFVYKILVDDMIVLPPLNLRSYGSMI